MRAFPYKAHATFTALLWLVVILLSAYSASLLGLWFILLVIAFINTVILIRKVNNHDKLSREIEVPDRPWRRMPAGPPEIERSKYKLTREQREFLDYLETQFKDGKAIKDKKHKPPEDKEH